jgi:hypothetical protein
MVDIVEIFPLKALTIKVLESKVLRSGTMLA